MLGLLFTSYLFQLVLSVLNILTITGTTYGLAGYVFIGVICLIGGFTFNVSFAVFALEYYKAAFTIAMVKQG